MNGEIIGYRLRYAYKGRVLWWTPFRAAETAKGGIVFPTKEEARARRSACNKAWQKHAKVVRVRRTKTFGELNKELAQVRFELARTREELRQERATADRMREEAFALRPDAEAWRKGQEALRQLQELVIPCGHKIEDLIGGEGSVTKCGACLADRQTSKPPNDSTRPLVEEPKRIPCEACKGTGDSLYAPNEYCSVCHGECFTEVKETES